MMIKYGTNFLNFTALHIPQQNEVLKKIKH
jgi:hypothetical protein